MVGLGVLRKFSYIVSKHDSAAHDAAFTGVDLHCRSSVPNPARLRQTIHDEIAHEVHAAFPSGAVELWDSILPDAAWR